MEEKWRGEPSRRSRCPFDLDLVSADLLGMDCWVKEHSGLCEKK